MNNIFDLERRISNIERLLGIEEDGDEDDGLYEEDPEDFYDRKLELEEEKYASCTCGAYQYKNGKWIQVADCIC